MRRLGRFTGRGRFLWAVFASLLVFMGLSACGGGSGDEDAIASLMRPQRARVAASRCAVPSREFTQVGGHCLAMDTGRLASARQKPLAVGSGVAVTPSADQLMDWAEATFPEVFPGHAPTVTGYGFTYRFYPLGRSAIGVDGAGGVYLLLLDLDDQLLYVGQIEEFTCEVLPAAASCGGPVTGGTFGTGDFAAVIADRSIPPDAATAPVAKALTALPANLPLRSHEVNVTAGAAAYSLATGTAAFHTGIAGNVQLEVPFNRSRVTDVSKIDSLHLLLRVLNQADQSVVDLTGQIKGDKVVADLTGFPSSATIVVVFNAHMDVAVSDTAVSMHELAAALSPSTWATRSWAVAYDGLLVAADVKAFLGLNGAPTAAQIKQVIRQQVANHAADAAAIYQGEGFRSPTLYVARSAAEPGGEVYGTSPRYLLHLQTRSTGFVAEDPQELVGPDQNHFGRVYVQSAFLNEQLASTGVSVYGVVAHELFHAVQAGYGLSGKANVKGVREGTASAYGDLLDRRHNGEPHAVPSPRRVTRYADQVVEETFKLENHLLTELAGHGRSYANQDFFVYLARIGGGNDFGYLAPLFEQLRLTIEDDANRQADPAGALANPSLETVYRGFDLFLKAYGVTLVPVYADFVQQRAVGHNVASQFGRPGETTRGVAVELFNADPFMLTDGFVDLPLDPGTVGTRKVDTLTPLQALSARVLRIRATAVRSGASFNLSVTPDHGALGSTVSGWVYRRPSAGAAYTAVALQAANAIEDFGASAGDEVVLLIINPSFGAGDVGVVVDVKGASQVRFVNNGNGTITDTVSGLTWLRNVDCFPSSNWEVAMASANALASGRCGLTDGSAPGTWHLPTVTELRVFVDTGLLADNLSAAGFQGVTTEHMWTSSLLEGSAFDAWFVTLPGRTGDTGWVLTQDKSSRYRVWPVRTGR